MGVDSVRRRLAGLRPSRWRRVCQDDDRDS